MKDNDFLGLLGMGTMITFSSSNIDQFNCLNAAITVMKAESENSERLKVVLQVEDGKYLSTVSGVSNIGMAFNLGIHFNVVSNTKKDE